MQIGHRVKHPPRSTNRNSPGSQLAQELDGLQLQVDELLLKAMRGGRGGGVVPDADGGGVEVEGEAEEEVVALHHRVVVLVLT